MNAKVINEVDFQELNKESEKGGFIDNKKAIINSQVDLDVTIGSAVKTIGDVLSLKVGDVIVFNKKSDKLYDIRVNQIECAGGETLYVDGKLNIRLLEI